MQRNNRTGERFGKLVVTAMVYKTVNGRPRTYANCKCDCGKETIKLVDTLLNSKKKGYISSCGCSRQESVIRTFGRNIDGERFGRLIVLRTIWKSKEYKKPMVECVCDCGKRVTLAKCDVQSMHTRSCGCLQREAASQGKIKDDTGLVSDSGVEILHKTRKNDKNQQLYLCKCFCGNTFEELPARIKNNHVQSCGCQIRSCKERFISNFLDSINIKYEQQYKFDECKSKYRLRFDFALFGRSRNLIALLEYDGEQHFRAIDFFGGEEAFTKTKARDSIKENFCKENNIKLVRLPYYLTNEQIKTEIMNIVNP